MIPKYVLPQTDSKAQSELEQGEEISSSDSESSEFVTTRGAGRREICEQCSQALSRYTCPACSLKTCSLSCTKKHKVVKGCSGIKKPTQYLSKQDISPNTVQKDYKFIEKMISEADKVKKCLTGVNSTIALEPRRFKILRANAKELYNIKIVNGPNILERHRNNISFYFVKSKSIFWVFELMIVTKVQKVTNNEQQSELKELRTHKKAIESNNHITLPISDSKKFKQIVPQDLLDKDLLLKGINTTKEHIKEFSFFFENKEKQTTNSSKIKELRGQISQKGFIDKRVVFERMSHDHDQSSYGTSTLELLEFLPNDTINQCLLDVMIFEFPSLYVVHRSLRQDFLETYKSIKTNNGSDSKSFKDSRIKFANESGESRERSRERNREIFNRQ